MAMTVRQVEVLLLTFGAYLVNLRLQLRAIADLLEERELISGAAIEVRYAALKETDLQPMMRELEEHFRRTLSEDLYEPRHEQSVTEGESHRYS